MRRAGQLLVLEHASYKTQPLSRLGVTREEVGVFLPVCSYDGHVWPRKKALFYVAWGRHGNFTRYRLRFCPSHAETVHEDLAQHEVSTANLADRVVYTGMAKCLSCGEVVDETGWQVYITGYPTQDERKDYWGCLHVDCTLPDPLRDSYSNA